MTRKNKKLELKIYELLGIKIFKKLILKIGFLMAFIPCYIESKSMEEAINLAHKHAFNYTLGDAVTLEKIRKFKKMLFVNGTFYFVKLVISLELLLELGHVSILLYLFCLYGLIKNAYCVMLQRYNQIRINEVLEKGHNLEEKRKNNLKEELEEENDLLLNNTYKLYQEENLNFKLFLERASYQELKDFKNYLTMVKREQIEESKPLTLNLRR